MVSVNFIFLHWLSNIFLWASSVPHHNYIFSQHHKIWPVLSIIIIHWNISSNTVSILQNYTAGNIVVYVTFQQIRENSKKIYILYIKFRKLCVKICEGSILNAETFLVEARQSLRCPISPQVASLSSHWPWSWHFPKWTGWVIGSFHSAHPSSPIKGAGGGGKTKDKRKDQPPHSHIGSSPSHSTSFGGCTYVPVLTLRGSTVVSPELKRTKSFLRWRRCVL